MNPLSGLSMPKISLSMIDNSPKLPERQLYDISERQALVIDELYERGMSWAAYAAKQQWEQLLKVPLADIFPEDLHEAIARANEDIIR